MGVIPDTAELCGAGNFHLVFQVKAEIPKLSAHHRGGRDVCCLSALGSAVQVTWPTMALFPKGGTRFWSLLGVFSKWEKGQGSSLPISEAAGGGAQ